MSAPPPAPAGRPAVPAATAIALPAFVILLAIATTCVVYVAVMIVVGPVASEPGSQLPFPPAWLFGGLAFLSIMTGTTMAALIRPKEDADARAWWTSIQTRLIVRAAIFESVAIFGLIARLLGASLFFGAGLAALGLVLTLSLLPGLVAAKTQLDERLAKESGGS